MLKKESINNQSKIYYCRVGGIEDEKRVLKVCNIVRYQKNAELLRQRKSVSKFATYISVDQELAVDVRTCFIRENCFGGQCLSRVLSVGF